MAEEQRPEEIQRWTAKRGSQIHSKASYIMVRKMDRFSKSPTSRTKGPSAEGQP
jgi:hypothetical protein